MFIQFDNTRWLRTNLWLLHGKGHLYDTGIERDESAGYIGLKQRKPLRTVKKDPNIGFRKITHSPEHI